MLDVSASASDGFVIVVPRGEVDAATAQHLSGTLQAATDGAERVVLDLRELNFMDSSGLRIVLTAAERASRAGTYELFVVRGPRRIQRVFELANVVDRIHWIDDPADLPAPA